MPVTLSTRDPCFETGFQRMLEAKRETTTDVDAALELLGPVFETLAAGFLDHTKVDPDLNPLRELPRFKAMVAAAEKRLAIANAAGSASGS